MPSVSPSPTAEPTPSAAELAAVLEDSLGSIRRAMDNAVTMGDYQTGFSLMTVYDALNSDLRGYYQYNFTAARTAASQATA